MIFYIISQTRFGKVDLRGNKFNRNDIPSFVVGGLAAAGLIGGLAVAGMWPASIMFAGLIGAAVAIGLLMPQKE